MAEAWLPLEGVLPVEAQSEEEVIWETNTSRVLQEGNLDMRFVLLDKYNKLLNGKLVFTNRRIIFSPLKSMNWVYKAKTVTDKGWEVPLEDIREIAVLERGEGGIKDTLLKGGVRDRVKIDVADGSTELFVLPPFSTDSSVKLLNEFLEEHRQQQSRRQVGSIELVEGIEIDETRAGIQRIRTTDSAELENAKWGSVPIVFNRNHFARDEVTTMVDQVAQIYPDAMQDVPQNVSLILLKDDDGDEIMTLTMDEEILLSYGDERNSKLVDGLIEAARFVERGAIRSDLAEPVGPHSSSL